MVLDHVGGGVFFFSKRNWQRHRHTSISMIPTLLEDTYGFVPTSHGVSKILSGTPRRQKTHTHTHTRVWLYTAATSLSFPLFNDRKRLLLYRFSCLMHRKSNLPCPALTTHPPLSLVCHGENVELAPSSFLAQNWKIHRPNHWWLLTPRCAISLHEQEEEFKKKKFYQNESKSGKNKGTLFGVAHEQAVSTQLAPVLCFPHASFMFSKPRIKRPDLPFPSRMITVQVLVQVAARAVVAAAVVVEPVQLQE